ncbi:hypothetical protein SLEP1_g28655 [Rubroshorea leprosula]|uniref:Uncharacterized protein n=1 Tax=Rubroshorea leprosula TaxID=152421 RepID=A0AAV5JUC2_9ROSI|nr:hypothetical protein SLEP1_g28655 [Rubroshorea leprosula]
MLTVAAKRESLDLSFTSVIKKLLSSVRGWAPRTCPYIQTMTKGKVRTRYESPVPVVPLEVSGLVIAGVNSESAQLDLGVQRRAMNDQIRDIISHLQVSKTSGKEDKREVEVPADDRTIFLTFSKGYPISEKEARDFFSRKFGYCIEAIHMQEVPAEERPLYARLVVHLPSSLEKILGRSRKAKISIGGPDCRMTLLNSSMLKIQNQFQAKMPEISDDSSPSGNDGSRSETSTAQTRRDQQSSINGGGRGSPPPAPSTNPLSSPTSSSKSELLEYHCPQLMKNSQLGNEKHSYSSAATK